MIVCPFCFNKSFSGGSCSSCQQRLPNNLDGSGLMFSIIGSTESGKSHYIAMLIAQLYSQARRFRWSCRALNDETMNLYDKRFRKRLYGDRETIVKTQADDDEAHRPLIYGLNFDSGAPSVMLVFYDAGGERFADEETMARTTRYLSESSGVIFLVDPLQFPEVREKFKASGEGVEADLPDPSFSDARVANVFQRLITVLHNREQSGAQKVQTPVAVTLSKIDALRFLLTDEAPLFLPSFHRRYGCFCRSEARRIDDYLRSFLAAIDPHRELLNQLQQLDNCCCFGMSALGQNPKSTEQRLLFPPRPLRVLDPFLWLLNQHGLIAEVD
jgi:DNA helicase HerA-like ATPase